MERIYIVANTTKFPVLLKNLNVIVPAKVAINLFEAAPELSIEQIKEDEQKGVLGLRLEQKILMFVRPGEPRPIGPRFTEPIVKKASEKKKPSKIIEIRHKEREVVYEEGDNKHKVNNEASALKSNKSGIVTMEALQEDE